ncbi:hypothetical protein J2853_008444 [Streptosporangium lutulentum]|uniref:Ankyrin repeat-containing protein n=1 Tax=Streptosporangium lutulentum TaxID=1461250 RepID=A0ABT9QR51_9ACTN|nr:hypothetical protein [Streptosporangium lutulentum]
MSTTLPAVKGPNRSMSLKRGVDAAALQGLVPEDAAQRGHVDLALAERLLGVDRRHDHQLDLLDLLGGQAAALEVLLDHGLQVGPQGVDPDPLPDQVARTLDRRAVGHEVADVAVLVAAVVADHGLDRGLGRGELDDGAVEGAPEVGLPGRGGLDVLRTGDRVADPLQFERAQVAELLGELGKGHGADASLVAKLQGFGLTGLGGGLPAAGGEGGEK